MARYEQVSAALFALIALAQLARAVLALPAQVGAFSIPTWWSLIAFAVTAAFAVWGFRSANRLTSA
jgi:hypothetical protein